MKVKSESEVSQSCPTLSDPMDCSPPGSSVHGIFQARVQEWVAIASQTSALLKFGTLGVGEIREAKTHIYSCNTCGMDKSMLLWLLCVTSTH